MLKDREQNLKLKKYTAKGKCNAITSGINIPEEHNKKKEFFFLIVTFTLSNVKNLQSPGNLN